MLHTLPNALLIMFIIVLCAGGSTSTHPLVLNTHVTPHHTSFLVLFTFLPVDDVAMYMYIRAISCIHCTNTCSELGSGVHAFTNVFTEVPKYYYSPRPPPLDENPE